MSLNPKVKHSSELRGAALVIVLSFLIILTGLVVAFLSSVTDEATSTSAAASAITTRALADAAIQLDIAQIRDATAGFARNANGALITASPVCWASQPGAIRTWDTNASNIATYKLYSATKLVETNGNNPTNDLPISGWWNKKALYTDLNSPVITRNTNGTANTNYPIMDPSMTNVASGGSPVVDGFSIDSSVPCFYTSNPAAMPVTWLYMLKDGTVIAPDTNSTTTATFSGTKPSSNNPIVGRIAFWTDDETCKLNINTASEGSFWATPSAVTLMDVSMALTPPVNREYNRYPGHPASTSLTPVLWSYFGLSNPAMYTGFLPGNPGNGFYFTNRYSSNSLLSYAVTNYYTNLFTNLIPRYVWGGSASGVSNTLLGANPITNLPVSRLYSSVDELIFGSTNRLPVGVGSNAAGMTPKNVSQLRFFLTAQSRAPEVNPFNLPKLTIWPVPDTKAMTANPQSTQGNTRTTIDKTIAFCSTLGTNGYYFTRYDATDAGNDFSTAGAVPGRNKVLYNYLRSMLNSPIPGFNGSFVGGSTVKWNTLQADQICTLLFDYIRSCINLIDSADLDLNGMTAASKPYPYSYTTPPTNVVVTNTPTGYGVGYNTNAVLIAGSGQVIPIVITNASGNVTKGIGRFPTINRGLLWFVARGADQPPLMVHPDRRPIVYATNGTQISVWTAATGSYIPTNNFPIVFAGQAYAKINPMHPWTCPQTNVVNKLTNVVPQLLGTGGIPVLSDTNILNFKTNQTLYTFDSVTKTAPLYPIFVLTNANANVPTRTYPTLNTNTTCIVSTNNPAVALQKDLITTDGLTPFNSPNNRYYCASLNTNASANITHGGLPYLTVQNPKTGAFDLPNINYKDTLTPALQPHQTRMEAVFLPSLANVAPGAVGYAPACMCTASNLNAFTVNGSNMGFPSQSSIIWSPTSYANSRYCGWNQSAVDMNSYGIGISASVNAQGDGGTNIKWYATNFPVVSAAAPTGESNGATFSFGGGTVAITLSTTNSKMVQSISMNFPNTVFPTPKLPPFIRTPGGGGAAPFPPNITSSYGISTNSSGQVGTNWTYGIAGHEFLTFNGSGITPWGVNNTNFGLWSSNANTINDGGSTANNVFNDLGLGAGQYLSAGDFLPEAGYNYTTNSYNAPWFNAGYQYAMSFTIEGVEALYGDTRLLASLSNVPSTLFTTNPYYGYSNSVMVNGWPMYVRNGFSIQDQSTFACGGSVGNLLPADATASSNNWSYLGSTLSFSYYVSNNPLVSAPAGYDRKKIFMSTSSGSSMNTVLPYTVPTCDFSNSTFQGIWQRGGDFDNGYGNFPDGPFIGKVDEGFGMYLTNWQYQSYNIPYYSTLYSPPGKTLMSANRMVPSALIFGSLPVGFGQMSSVTSPSTNMLTNSWLTLQFSPNPNSPSTNYLSTRTAAAGYNEGGSMVTNTRLPDHLLLDFFQMPVVEPYPISDPFSTAGKVNMNYQIAPFSHITRDTAIRGVLKSVMITAIDETYAGMYKYPAAYGMNQTSFSTTTYPSGTSYNQLASNSGNFYFHYPINASNTLAQFTNRFGQNDLFHSPSEICSVWLYPSRQPSSANPTNNVLPLNNSAGAPILYTNGNTLIKSWWYDNPATSRKGITGDNLRERPYSYLYPRLTTKSNTYQIHYCVQTLKQTPSAHPGSWSTWIDPSAGGITDKILGESRGSAVIERYIDPSDPSIPDFAANFVSAGGGAFLANTNTMDAYYRFRVFNAKQFTP